MRTIMNDIKIESGKFYDFKIFLDSPYKWGDGWGGVDSNIRHATENELENLCKVLEWNLQRGDSWSSDTFYKDFEEIYCHPMEISGCATIENIEKMEKYFKESTNHLHFYETRIFDECVIYTNEQFIEMGNEILNTYKEVAKKEPWGIACNVIKRHYPHFKFKRCSFAKNRINKIQESYEEILVDLLNEKIRSLRK